MASLPQSQPTGRDLPDLLPARMLNEFTYCPRLFFYEWVEGIFLESADTVEGAAQHQRVDKPGSRGLPAQSELEPDEVLHTRSLTLSSLEHGVIAKLDLLEATAGAVTPVDYKHGAPIETASGLGAWDPDRIQLAVQALVLRENGYTTSEGVLYYQKTKQRVAVPFTEELLGQTREAIGAATRLARYGSIPPPLEGSPKCVGCSLAPVCLPDEVTSLHHIEAAPAGGGAGGADQLQLFAEQAAALPRKSALREVRRLLAPRYDRKPLYLDTQGLKVGRSGEVLSVKEKEKTIQDVRIQEICQVNLMGNIQITTQAVQSLLEAEVPICYFSMGGWFFGMTTGLSTKNIFLRQKQFLLAGEPWFCRKLARQLTAGKIRNQRTFLLRNHLQPSPRVLAEMKEMAERAEEAGSLEELLGIEGNAARLYFGAFQGLIKVETEDGSVTSGGFTFDWEGRNRRPPLDPINALLSLGYSMLVKDLTIACYAVGFDPMLGYYHQPRFGRPALALDLMEPFRALIVDSAVVNAINTKMVTLRDFLRVGRSVALKPEGRKAFYRAYEARMDTLVTHPLFEYRLSYRRLLEVQARLLGKYLEGEIGEYPVFVTR
ncbi:MAG: CRISPR-associated endonuclease Cas1 [Bryobacterales bacterium]|nr:CRISPR-associated endonuclease Cas1 [Bryobacterales bacterium]